MPDQQRFPPDDPREWLNRARSDLALAQQQASNVYLEDLCFHAQQAAEKAIKAVLICQNVEFPYIHDLRRLLQLVAHAGAEVPPEVQQAETLTRFAVVNRYPGIRYTAEHSGIRQDAEVCSIRTQLGGRHYRRTLRNRELTGHARPNRKH